VRLSKRASLKTAVSLDVNGTERRSGPPSRGRIHVRVRIDLPHPPSFATVSPGADLGRDCASDHIDPTAFWAHKGHANRDLGSAWKREPHRPASAQACPGSDRLVRVANGGPRAAQRLHSGRVVRVEGACLPTTGASRDRRATTVQCRRRDPGSPANRCRGRASGPVAYAADQLPPRRPKLATPMDDSEHGVPACMTLPARHRPHPDAQHQSLGKA
jgi:hypothetical protein